MSTRRWGKAGERLHPDGTPDDSRTRGYQAEANRSRIAHLNDDHEAYRRWRAGLVCPNRITMALDMRQLEGPEVDLACGAQEPDVDQWEAGERYPSWDQLRALAKLTGFTLRWFTTDDEPLPIWHTSLWFRMSDADREVAVRDWRPVMRYPRAVLDERPDSPAEMPEPVTL